MLALLLISVIGLSVYGQTYSFQNCSQVSNVTQASMTSQFKSYFSQFVSMPSPVVTNATLLVNSAICYSSNSSYGCYNVGYTFIPCCSSAVNGTCVNTTSVGCPSYSSNGFCLSYTALTTGLVVTSATTATTLTTATSTVTTTTTTTTSAIATVTPTTPSSASVLLGKILNPVDGKSPALQIVAQINQSALASSYSVSGARIYSYNGPLNLWVSMARPLREAMMGNGVLNMFGANGQFDVGTAAANSVGVLVAVSITFVFALVGIIMAPCNIIGLYQKVKKERERKLREKLEADEMKDAENAAAKGLTARDLEKEKERKMREKKKLDALQGKDDKSEKIKIYSLQQRMNAVIFLLVVMSFNMACLIIASVATAQADTSFNSFRDLALNSLDSLANMSVTIGNKMNGIYSPARIYPMADAVSTLPTEVFKQNIFPYVYPNTTLLLQTMNGLKSQHQQYLGNATNVLTLLSTLNTQEQALSDYYTNALPQADINPNAASCAIIGSKLPVMSAQSPVVNNYADLPSFSSNIAVVSDPSVQNNFYSQILIMTDTINSMYDSADAPVFAKAQSFLRSYADNYQIGGQLQYASLKQLFVNTTYVTKVALNSGAYYLGYRSNGAYVLIMLGFFSSSFSALLILFGRWQFVRLLNLAHWVVMAGFWLLCGTTLLMAYLNGHFCNGAAEQFATWNPSLAIQAQDANMPTYVSMMFNARAQCLANNSQPLIQLANRYSSAKYGPSQFQGLVSSAYDLADATNISTFANSYAASLPNLDTAITLSSNGPVFKFVTGMNALQSAPLSSVNSVSSAIQNTPYRQYINAGNLPFYNDPSAQNNAISGLTSYIQNADTSYFVNAGTASACLTQFKSANGGPSLLPSVRAKISAMESSIQQTQQQITSSMSSIESLAASVSSLSISFAQQILPYQTQPGTLYNLLNSQIGSSSNVPLIQAQFQPIAVRVAAQIQAPLSQIVDCSELGDQISDAEPLCQASLVGMDASYWAFGALAFLAFLQIRAFVLASDRLAEDSRWLIMAMLLRQNNKTGGGTDRLTRKQKVNITGTTYLQEADFDMNFNDPSLAHTRV